MNSSVTFILFVFLVTVWTCSEQEEGILSNNASETDGMTMYKIPSQSHFSQQSTYQALDASEIAFTARFDSSAVYQAVDPRNQGDINKLYGMSDCNTSHQTNSARFGWRWFANELEIWAYAYVNSERKVAFIKAIPLQTTSTYKIIFADSAYRFIVDESEVSIPRHCAGRAQGYKLYPYFGGDEPAPHDVTIQIREIR
ncbi:MAG TPA: hypothetical protein VF490_10885 [Chryseosolibacter sp.]